MYDDNDWHCSRIYQKKKKKTNKITETYSCGCVSQSSSSSSLLIDFVCIWGWCETEKNWWNFGISMIKIIYMCLSSTNQPKTHPPCNKCQIFSGKKTFFFVYKFRFFFPLKIHTHHHHRCHHVDWRTIRCCRQSHTIIT